MKNLLLNVRGMSCSHCVSTIEKALSSLEGVISVVVSLEDKNVSVDYDETRLNPEAISDTIQDSGYTVL
ncbi:heavy-metal-associated domain-containing protein [Alkalibacter saccharofermentans]|uniref:Copper chaperone CopZ n=1 Tax=Alkalibacter saccharofermentans DSM 14828 TaxID=1120975 RepID=A0A1M4X403_9FIRM|nr:copper ion binding protein [Alkalibacter saccharofermentans]SHE88189.1 copper chaperone [Alkalibacter saccharofermentans DSM 14828]